VAYGAYVKSSYFGGSYARLAIFLSAGCVPSRTFVDRGAAGAASHHLIGNFLKINTQPLKEICV
jgi:hypothetical protein